MNHQLSWTILVLLILAEPAGPWRIVSIINDQWKLAAFALAIVLFIVVRSRGNKVSPIIWAVIVLLVVIPIGASVYSGIAERTAVYRLRVTVVNPQGVPVEDARVWSSFGGEPKRVAGGWQFDIPNTNKPKDGKLTIYASKETAFLTGQMDLILGSDSNPAVTVNLNRDNMAKVRGQVVDNKNHAVAGARVFIVGYESDAIVTGEGGNFELPAHAALDQQVLLHAEKSGYSAVKLRHPAGDAPAVLILKR